MEVPCWHDGAGFWKSELRYWVEKDGFRLALYFTPGRHIREKFVAGAPHAGVREIDASEVPEEIRWALRQEAAVKIEAQLANWASDVRRTLSVGVEPRPATPPPKLSVREFTITCDALDCGSEPWDGRLSTRKGIWRHHAILGHLCPYHASLWSSQLPSMALNDLPPIPPLSPD